MTESINSLLIDSATRLIFMVKRLLQCAKSLFLPIVLAVLFVLQNTAFNDWLNIEPNIYMQMYASAFALGVLLYGPAAFMRSRSRYVYLMTISLFVSGILMAEYLYYSYSGGFLQISALKLTGESDAVIGTAMNFVTPKLLLFLSGPLLIFFIGFIPRFKKNVPTRHSLSENIAIAFFILVVIFGGYHTLLAAEKKDFGNSSRLYSMQYDLNTVVGKMGVVNYFLEDAAKRVFDIDKITADDKTFVKNWNATRSETVGSKKAFGIAKNRNLIFIQVESLENAVVGTKIGGEEITPRLNALKKEGLYYSNYYTQVGMGNTADAEFTTLNSLYPLPDSVAFVDHAQNTYAALPQLLVDNGYDTNVFHGDVSTFWNRANIYPSLGYQTWFMKNTFNITRQIGITGLGDEDFFQQSLPKIETLKEPFMATLITLSSHTPFILPEDLRALKIPANSGLDDTQTHYLESIQYSDRVLGDFIDQLKKTSLYDHSVIVIFGDHGSYTGISKALGVETNAVDEMNNAQVPLLIITPGTGLSGEQTIPASHIDVYPTVANLLGLETPHSVLGQDLLNTTTPVVVHRKGTTGGVSAILGAKVLYIASFDGIFSSGSCLSAKTRPPVSIDDCQSLFDQQSAILRVSDTVVRGDLIDSLLTK